MTTKIIAVLAVFVASGVATAAGPTVTPALLEKGKASYTMNCVACHGESGDGNGVAGALMNPKPRNFLVDKFKKGDKPDKVFKTLKEGLVGTSMVGFEHLPEDERWALTHYLLSFRKAKK